jgi:hypothetical protein
VGPVTVHRLFEAALPVIRSQPASVWCVKRAVPSGPSFLALLHRPTGLGWPDIYLNPRHTEYGIVGLAE